MPQAARTMLPGAFQGEERRFACGERYVAFARCVQDRSGPCDDEYDALMRCLQRHLLKPRETVVAPAG